MLAYFLIQKHPFPMKKRMTIAKVNKIQNKNALELEKSPRKGKKITICCWNTYG